MNSPVEAYSGSQPYIFVSYAHGDKALVIPIISHMVHSGYRIWYDDGIDPGAEWDDNIASHVQECSCFVAFISRNYLDSDNCKDELNYARDLKKERLLVYLENVNLPAGMAMRLNRLQAIYWNTYRDKSDFYSKLFTANPFELCKKGHFEKQHPIYEIEQHQSMDNIDFNDEEVSKQHTWLREISDTAVALGIDIELKTLVSVDLCKTRSIAIYGKKRFGKSNLLYLLADGAKQIPNVRFVCWDDGRGELSQNEVLSRIIQTNKQSVKILYSGQEFLDYLEDNGYYSFKYVNPYLPQQDNSAQAQIEISTANPFTVFIIQSRMFYQNFDARNNFIRKLAPYIIDESYGNKLFIFSDVQNIMDYEMRMEFNNLIDHAFLLDDITRFVSGKGEKSIFSLNYSPLCGQSSLKPHSYCN